MRAQPGLEGNIARLLERADEVARPETRPQHRCGIAGIGAQIAIAQIGRREKRSAASQIQNDIAVRTGLVARRPKYQLAPRGWRGVGEIVDHELECAEMTPGISDPAFRYRKIVDTWRLDGCRRFDPDGDVEA